MFALQSFNVKNRSFLIDSQQKMIYRKEKSDKGNFQTHSGIALIISILGIVAFIICTSIPVANKTPLLNLSVGIPLGFAIGLFILIRGTLHYPKIKDNLSSITSSNMSEFGVDKKAINDLYKRYLAGLIIEIGIYLFTIYQYLWGSYKGPSYGGIGYSNGNVWLIGWTFISILLLLVANPIKIIMLLSTIKKYKIERREDEND